MVEDAPPSAFLGSHLKALKAKLARAYTMEANAVVSDAAEPDAAEAGATEVDTAESKTIQGAQARPQANAGPQEETTRGPGAKADAAKAGATEANEVKTTKAETRMGPVLVEALCTRPKQVKLFGKKQNRVSY